MATHCGSAVLGVRNPNSASPLKWRWSDADGPEAQKTSCWVFGPRKFWRCHILPLFQMAVSWSAENVFCAPVVRQNILLTTFSKCLVSVFLIFYLCSSRPEWHLTHTIVMAWLSYFSALRVHGQQSRSRVALGLDSTRLGSFLVSAKMISTTLLRFYIPSFLFSVRMQRHRRLLTFAVQYKNMQPGGIHTKKSSPRRSHSAHGFGCHCGYPAHK